jgi:tetratricopeptide (TPR) repeat protein
MWKVAGALAVLLVISGAVRKAHRAYLPVGWLWFIGCLVPMIGLVQVGMQARADRYMYLPLTGVLIIVVWGARDLIEWQLVSRGWAAAAAILVLAALSLATHRQLGYWRNSETLWTYTLGVTNDNFMAEDNLAQELAHQGRTQEAMVHFHKTLNLYRWGARDLIAFGVYEQRHGYAADAIEQYQRAFSRASDAHLRAVALSNIGSAYLDLRNRARARESFEEALRLDPTNVPALLGDGLIAHKGGNLDSAIQQYSKAVALAPSDFAYVLLGRALEESGRLDEAANAYDSAKHLNHELEPTIRSVQHLLAD